MQFRSFFLISISAAFLVSSCLEEQREDSEDPYLSVSEQEIIAPAEGCSSVIIVSANNPWTVVAPEWCRVSTDNSTVNDKLFITVEENSSYDSRNGSIEISSGDLVETIDIVQEALGAILVPDVKYDLSSEAQNISVKVESNVEYEIEVDSDWIHYVDTKSLTTYECRFAVDENDSYDLRIGYISIKNKKSGEEIAVMVRQSQKDAIILSETDYCLSSDEHSLQIKLSSNVEVLIDVPEYAREWIELVDTKALEEHCFYLNIDANEGYEERECEINVCDLSETISQPLNIKQAAHSAVFISNKEYVVSCSSHTIDVEIQTNVEYEVIISQAAADWIHYVPTKALSDEIVTLQIDKNDSYDDRTGEVYIRESGGTISDTLVVKQAQNDQMLLSQSIFEISGKEQMFSTTVMTNVDTSVIIPDDAAAWLTILETRALEDRVLSFSVSRNATDAVRSADILISAELNGKMVCETLSVIQDNIVTTMAVLKKDKTELFIDLYDDSKVFFLHENISVVADGETYDIPMRDIMSITYISIDK